MEDMWTTLEERTRAWNALRRQGLADAIWADYVSFRFARTGDPRALEYLYPYLNQADKRARLRAIEVAARVFEGRGARVIGALGYFTENPDPFLRDRAVQVVGAAVSGSRDSVALQALDPYLSHRNQFIRKLALVALGKACAGQASARVLAEIQRVAKDPGPSEREVDLAIARAFAGRPSEETYALVAKPELYAVLDSQNERAVSVLVRGAPEQWYRRACQEIFDPRLHIGSEAKRGLLIQRTGIVALCHASPGRGMETLKRILPLRGRRCTGHAMMRHAQECFAAADPELNRAPLIELARDSDVPAQRIASVCLGRMMMGAEDSDAIEVLHELCSAGNGAVRSAALTGLGMAARSTCDETLRRACLDCALNDETAASAILALGMVFLGSGRADVLGDIRRIADVYRSRPVWGRRHCKPLAACYRATGLAYLGTGSMEPLEFLLDVLALPRVSQWMAYQWSAAKALIMVEFSEARLPWSFLDPQ